MSRHAPKARERLIETASELFYARGFGNVGINDIFEAAGVARGTLYYNFGSKHDLIRAVLERRLEQRLSWLKSVEEQTEEPRARLERAIEMHLEWMQGDTYRGCSFLNALIEMGAEADEVKDLTLKQKEAVRVYFETLAGRAGLTRPEAFSFDLMVLLDGATVTALFRSPEGVTEQARTFISRLMTEYD